MNQSEEIKSAEELVNQSVKDGLCDFAKKFEKYDLVIKPNDVLKLMHEYHNQFKSEWVSVEDRLPELFAPVLVYTIHGNIAVGNLCYDSKMWNLSSGEPFRLGFVTHWQAFPTHPKA